MHYLYYEARSTAQNRDRYNSCLWGRKKQMERGRVEEGHGRSAPVIEHMLLALSSFYNRRSNSSKLGRKKRQSSSNALPPVLCPAALYLLSDIFNAMPSHQLL